MTVDDIEVLLKDTEHNGYPVVVSRENQYLVGFILRKDLNLAIGKLQMKFLPFFRIIKLFFYSQRKTITRRHHRSIFGDLHQQHTRPESRSSTAEAEENPRHGANHRH